MTLVIFALTVLICLKLFSLLAVVLTGCGGKFNVPSLNTVETLQLEPSVGE